MTRDIYLTDEEYLSLLIKARKHLDEIDKITGFDCDIIGCKDTQCNAGLCNDDLTWRAIAAFPKRYPECKFMKYRKHHHRCPLDPRPVSYKLRNGCFYTCLFFQDGIDSLESVKELYDYEIERVRHEVFK